MEKNWRDDIEAQKETATEYEPDEKTAQQLIKIFIYIYIIIYIQNFNSHETDTAQFRLDIALQWTCDHCVLLQ